MLLNVRRPLRSLMAASLLVIIGACDSNTPSNAAGTPNAKAGAAQKSGAATRDWTQTVVATPEGGFRMGNPDAPVKLVEFASLQCSHCKTFHEEGMTALKRDYVAPGRVSYEMRTFVLGPVDVPVTLAARCQGPGPFFRIADDVFKSQGDWLQQAQDNQAQFQQLQGRSQVDQLTGILGIIGMDSFFRARGLPSAKLQQCMQDKTQLDAITRIRNDGIKYNIPGTPAFLINGTLVQDSGTWAALEPKLRDALN
jgi:protein-disulfide isomerase